jgi:hypothetical protein
LLLRVDIIRNSFREQEKCMHLKNDYSHAVHINGVITVDIITETRRVVEGDVCINRTEKENNRLGLYFIEKYFLSRLSIKYVQ